MRNKVYVDQMLFLPTGRDIVGRELAQAGITRAGIVTGGKTLGGISRPGKPRPGKRPPGNRLLPFRPDERAKHLQELLDTCVRAEFIDPVYVHIKLREMRNCSKNHISIRLNHLQSRCHRQMKRTKKTSTKDLNRKYTQEKLESKVFTK